MFKLSTTIVGAKNVARPQSQQGKPRTPNGKAPARVVKSASTQNGRVGAKTKPKPQVRTTAPANNNRAPANNNRAPKIILQDVRPGSAKSVGQNRKQAAPTKVIKQPVKTNNNQANRSQTRPNSGRQSVPQQQAAAPAARAPARSGKGSVSELTLALQTANSIAINRAHPRQTEVVELLRTHEKGWIDDNKFTHLLKGLVF